MYNNAKNEVLACFQQDPNFVIKKKLIFDQ